MLAWLHRWRQRNDHRGQRGIHCRYRKKKPAARLKVWSWRHPPVSGLVAKLQQPRVHRRVFRSAAQLHQTRSPAPFSNPAARGVRGRQGVYKEKEAAGFRLEEGPHE